MSTAVATEYPTRMYIEAHGVTPRGAEAWRSSIRPTNPCWPKLLTAGGKTRSERSRRPLAHFPNGDLSVYDRAKILKKTAELMRDRADRIARALTQEQGKPLAEAKMEVLHAAETFEWFAEEGKRAYGRIIPPSNIAKRHYAIKHPMGVVGTITPWNFPAALAQPQNRPGPGRRLHGREPPCRSDAADLDPDVRVPGRCRTACRSRESGDRRAPGRSPTRSSSSRPYARSASRDRRRSARNSSDGRPTRSND